jgi:hypothetical protein
MDRTPDKPAGTEQHPPDVNPARQGPGEGKPRRDEQSEKRPPGTGEPRPEASPGEPGVSGPKQGKI